MRLQAGECPARRAWATFALIGALALVDAALGGEPAGPEATSLLGEPLAPPPIAADFRNEQLALLDAAREGLAAVPGDPEALIWVGRRTAYLGRYREAVEIFTEGIRRYPRDARFLRHRGHRFLTLRQLDEAVADLEMAAALVASRPDEIEPDGLPNARGIPTSTLQTNIWYHLGLARYLQRDLERALAAYQVCLQRSKNPDMEVAARYWLYLIQRRLGRDAAALATLEPVSADLDVIENHAYHRLLLLFKGELDAGELLAEARGEGGIAAPTTAYGIAAWHLAEGRSETARALLEEIVAGDEWPAFGHLAAEADLAWLRAAAP